MGASGTTAALRASEGGASVIGIEATESIGGFGNAAQGMFAVGSVEQEARYTDGETTDEEYWYDHFQERNNNMGNSKLIREFISEAKNTVSYMLNHGVGFFLSETAQQIAHFDTEVVYHRWNNANPFEYLGDALDEAGVDVHYATTANSIIVDKDGNPLIGVTIFEKGTDNGCITDFNGQYQLSLSNRDAVIVISYVGYKTQELKGDQLVEKIVLEEDAVALDELVVVGYAVQKKKELTGSTSSLKASDKKLSVTTSLDQMMQGNLSGVNITNASGMPGGAVRVSIRGVGSINGSNEPLFVIDGIPVSNSDNSGVNGRFGGSVQNPLSMLNPNDIESIDVLKDAAATAIYGSRATNGVVMVTTKRGKKGQRTTVNLSASYGLQSLPKEIEMADSDLYLTVRNEAVNNYNTQNNLKPGDNLYKTLEVNPRPGQPDTDWIDLITHDQAAVQNYEVSVSSGSEKTRFYSSLGYFDQEGIILTNRFRRYSLRTNVDHDISNAFQAGVSIALSKTINNRVPNDNVGNGIFTRSIEQRPFDVPFKEDGRYMIGGVDIPRHNGIQVLNEQKSKNEWYRVLANAYLTIKLLEGLELSLIHISEPTRH